MQLPQEHQADLDAAVAEILEAFRLFSATLTNTQRAQLLFPLDGMERTPGRDTSLTPSMVLKNSVLGPVIFREQLRCSGARAALVRCSTGPGASRR
jgi:hypothetical protein